MENSFQKFSGYILAGGKSSRMGTDKALLKIGEKTFLENAIDILKPVCERRIKVVLNRNQTSIIESLPPSMPHILDIYDHRGALGGIHAAMKDCQTEFVAILAIDLPFVTSDFFKTLFNIANVSSKYSAFIPLQEDDRPQPLASIYRARDCISKAQKLLEKHRSVSVKKFLEKIAIKKVKLRKDIFININYPEDLVQAKLSSSIDGLKLFL